MNGSCPWMGHGKLHKKHKRIRATMNYPPILPDFTGILNAYRCDDDHLSWHLLAARLPSLSNFVKLDQSFGNREMRTPKYYVNSRDSGLPFFLILSSEVVLQLLCFWGSSLRRKSVEWDWVPYRGRLCIGVLWLVMSFWILMGMRCLSSDGSGQQQSASVVSLCCCFN